MSNKDDLLENPDPLAKTWYGENTSVTVKLIKYIGNDQWKVQFGDDDCAKFFSRRIVDLKPITKYASDLLFVEKMVEPKVG